MAKLVRGPSVARGKRGGAPAARCRRLLLWPQPSSRGPALARTQSLPRWLPPEVEG